MITIDFETKSYADLTKVGAWAYSRDLSTDLICVSWGFEAEPLQVWVPGDGDPVGLFKMVEEGVLVEAHNVAFERSIWENVLTPRYGWPLPAEEQWRDTMAVAAYYGMPLKLEMLARALGYQTKDPEGTRLISKYSKLYLKTAKPEIPPEDLEKFIEYCKQDVRIEQSISDHLGDLPERELPIFMLDQKINRRGLHLDLEGIEVATGIVDRRAAQLTEEFQKLTGLSPTQTAKVKDWICEQGLEVENLQADYLRELLDEGDIPQGPARRAIEIRLEINKASNKKLLSMARQCGDGDRAYFQVRYHGAVTGRWTGTGIQPLNLNRGFEGMDPHQLTRDIMHDDEDWLDLLYGDAIDAIAKATRHWIKAEQGYSIMAGDFVSVEAVVLACLAGEEWKIDAFHRKEKIYERMADKIYGLPAGTVSKATHPQERFDGKTGELAFGYQGALGAWLKFDNSGRHTDERIIEICKAWRAEHPAIVNFWYGLQEQAISAVNNPGKTYYYRQIGFEVIDEWLTMILPNEKRLWYYKPYITMVMPRWHQPKEKPECADNSCRCKLQPQLRYWAQKEGQWRKVSTYGGKLCLAGNTEVLTDRGWINILKVQASDKLWDGDHWVGHSGLIYQGEKNILELNGVGMTPDHLVLTTEGWRSASQSEGYYRASSWAPNSHILRGKRWAKVFVERQLRVWGNKTTSCNRAGENEKTRRHSFSRLSQKQDHLQTKNFAWQNQSSAIRSLVFNVGALFQFSTRSMAQLWGARHIRMRPLAKLFPRFLGRYVSHVQERFTVGAHRQRGRLLAYELPLGHTNRASSQPENQQIYKHTQRQDGGSRSFSRVWHKKHYVTLEITKRMAGRQSVYDLTNAGPQKRFMVRGKGRAPLIVHNCENATQAVSREILVPAMFRVEEAGYPIILSVYDEIVCEVPENHGSLEEFKSLMEITPEWAADWPISVDVWQGDRYRK